MTSTTQLSLNYLRKLGYTANIVEHWNSFAHIRQDLFGFIDIVAIKTGELGVLGVQSTSKSNISTRRRKIESLPEYIVWKGASNRIVIHGWAKSKKRNKWELTEYIL